MKGLCTNVWVDHGDTRCYLSPSHPILVVWDLGQGV